MLHVDQGIQIKRQLIEDLRPTVLLNLGLREAIIQSVEDGGARNQWETTWSCRFPAAAARAARPSRYTGSCRNR